MCLPHDESWGSISLIMQEFAFMKLWRLGFVGVGPDGNRTKLPVPLAEDPGLIK